MCCGKPCSSAPKATQGQRHFWCVRLSALPVVRDLDHVLLEVLALTIATATATTNTASGVSVLYLFCYRLCHSLLAATPWHDEGLNTEVVVTMVHQHSKTDPRDTITAWCRCASRKDGFAHQSCISSIGRASLPRRASLAPCSDCPAQLLLYVRTICGYVRTDSAVTQFSSRMISTRCVIGTFTTCQLSTPSLSP